jgi:hypothetical protein
VALDPGRVPAGYTPDACGGDLESCGGGFGGAGSPGSGVTGAGAGAAVGGPVALLLEVKKSNGNPRFCRKCSPGGFKPPRTHHCRVCGRCVLRMCHHCPWTANCVGHMNYKSYFLFLRK